MGNEQSSAARPQGHTDEPWALFPGEAPRTSPASHAEHDIFPTDWDRTAAPAKEGPEREASMMIQKHIRRKSSQRAANYETAHELRPMLIHIKTASGLRAADRNGLSDPFVVVHVAYKDDDGNVVTTFVSRSQKINKTLTPEWNFDVFLPGVNESMNIVMTVMDWDRFANDDFLGQAVFPVPSSQRIASDAVEKVTHANGSTIKKILHERSTGVALAEYELGLGDLDKSLQPVDGMSDTEEKGQGQMQITIDHFGGMAHSQCGYLFKAFSKEWAKRWVVLAGTSLFEYKRWADGGKHETLDVKTATKCVKLPDSDKFENVFEITYKAATGGGEKRAFYKCEGASECGKWVQRIKMAMGEETQETTLAGANKRGGSMEAKE